MFKKDFAVLNGEKNSAIFEAEAMAVTLEESLIARLEAQIDLWVQGVKKSFYVVEGKCPYCEKPGRHELVFKMHGCNKCQCHYCHRDFILLDDQRIKVLGQR